MIYISVKNLKNKVKKSKNLKIWKIMIVKTKILMKSNKKKIKKTLKNKEKKEEENPKKKRKNKN